MNISVINVYSREFVDFITNKNVNLGNLIKEIDEAIKFISTDKSFVKYISAPIIDLSQKLELLDNIVKNQDILNLFSVLDMNKKSKFFISTLTKISKLLKKQSGIVDVEVSSTIELSQSQIQKVKQLVKKTFNYDAEINTNIDQSLIGGIVIQVENNVLDMSLKKQFEKMYNKVSIALANI